MKSKLYLIILLALIPHLVNALGLGNLDLNSALNEPFDGRIQLLSATADELDSLKVGLAGSEAFERAKIDRPFLLSKLRFTLHRAVDDGPDYIRVYSQDPIREPFLNFLVEVNWSKGRLFREYTVLLDPPMYDPNARAREFKQSTSIATPMGSVDNDHKVVYAEDFAKYNRGATSAAVSSPSINYAGGDYGPTAASDTLWSIASAMRPDSSVSVNQMMLALLRANPDAFFNQNINGLKRGQILRMPSDAEINALNKAEALAETKTQYAAWEDVKGTLITNVSEQPDTSSTPVSSESVSEIQATPVEAETEESELKLVAANESGESSEQAASVDNGTNEELILAQESIQALTQENIELKDRLQESEALLNDLKRLLQLKDDELAALQEQIATQQTTPAAEEPMAEEEAMEEEEMVSEEPVVEETMEEEEMVSEEEPVAEEETMEEEEMVSEEPMDEEMEVVEEEEVGVIDTEPETGSSGIIGMLEPYLAPLTGLLGGNPIYAIAAVVLLVVLILVVVLMKFRGRAETVDLSTETVEAFPDFESGDMGEAAAEDLDSEAETVLPGSEEEIATPEEDIDIDLDEEAKTEFVSQPEVETEEMPAEEEEEDEDPLQEVNTYLAFEQFDQAEEFVRNAINDNPDNAEFHTKLLEVFYTSGNKKAYEEEAKILHDLVGGEGEHWNMAVAMWSEMSPNRALFEEGEDEEDSAAETTGGGFVDVTADEEVSDEGDLDFDIGAGAEENPVEADKEEDVLDVTAAVGLDDTDSSETGGDDVLDISGSSAGSEDLLDITAASDEEETSAAEEPTDDEILDISGASAGSEDLLDITSSDESAGEDLLDVTAATNLELDSDEDLLDVTAATSAGADSSELLDFDVDTGEEESSEPETKSESETVEFDVGGESAEDNIIDFDLASGGSEESAAESSEEDAGLEIDLGGSESDAGLEMDLGDTESGDDAGLEIDLGESESGEPIRLDVEEDAEAEAPSEDELSIDLDIGADDDIGLDLGEEGDLSLDSSEEGLSKDESEADTIEADISDMDFDLSIDESSDETPAEEVVPEIDMDLDGTVEIPKSALESGDDDEDEEDHTVFVPRAAQPEEQSQEDEIATKLDLAKAYVELGDKDSAKTILDEVMADGNDEQKKQAEELLGQI